MKNLKKMHLPKFLIALIISASLSQLCFADNNSSYLNNDSFYTINTEEHVWFYSCIDDFLVRSTYRSPTVFLTARTARTVKSYDTRCLPNTGYIGYAWGAFGKRYFYTCDIETLVSGSVGGDIYNTEEEAWEAALGDERCDRDIEVYSGLG